MQALEFMRQTIVDGLSSPTSTQSLEEDVRRVFSSGQASLALNWTYMYGLANDQPRASAGRRAGSPDPERTVRPSGCERQHGARGRGGQPDQDAAWKFVEYVTSQQVQDKYALSSLPVWESSYDDPAVGGQDQPGRPAGEEAAGRPDPPPQVESYNAMSQALQAEIQLALLGDKTPQQALDDAASKASSLLES